MFFLNPTKILRNYSIFAFIAFIISITFQGGNDFLFSLILPFADIILIYLLFNNARYLSERQFTIFIFVFSLIIRIFGVYMMNELLIQYNGMPFLSYKDDYIYNYASIEILNRWQNYGIGFYNDIRFSADTYSGFPNFSAALMGVFGTSHIVPRIGNAVVSSLTVVIGYKICKTYSNKNRARALGVILALLPLTIIFSTLQLKDTLLLFFIVLGIYACINILRNESLILSVFCLVISFTGIIFGRPASVVPIAVSFIYMIIRKRRGRIISILTLIISIVVLYKILGLLDSYGFASLDSYFDSRFELMSSASIQDSDANIKNLSIAQLLGAPVYLIFSFFLPPPLLVKINDESFNYSAWALLEHYAFLPYLITAFVVTIRMRNKYPIPFFLVLTYIIFRIGQANTIFTSFSPRQSLGTLFLMYLILPMYQSLKKWDSVIICISIMVLLAYNFFRLYSHNLI